MLEIFANGVKLALPDDISLNLIIENPLFQADKIPVPYSLNFDVAIKPNEVIFKYPQRVTAFVREEYTAEVRFRSITVFNGILEIVNVSNRISLSFKGVDIFSAFKGKLENLDLGTYNIGKLLYEDYIDYSEDAGGITKRRPIINRNSPTNIAGKYQKLFNDSIVFANDIPFYTAPIKLVTGTTAVDGPPAFYADEKYINFYNNRTADFNITAYWRNIDGSSTLGDYLNTRAFPYPYIGKIINYFFADLIISHPFTTGELAKLVLITSYHPLWARVTGDYEDLDMQGMLVDQNWPVDSTNDYTIAVKKFMPDATVIELLKQVLKLFCATLVPIGGKFKILLNKDVLSNTALENWSEKLIDQYQLSIRTLQNYKYEYADIEDLDISEFDIQELSTIANLIAVFIGVGDEEIQYFRITTTGEVYKKERIGDNDYEYTRLVSGFAGVANKEDDTFDVSAEISPLPMSVHKTFDQVGATFSQFPPTYFWYVPEISDADRQSRSSALHIMFARGMSSIPGKATTYPLVSGHNKGISGEDLGAYSLQWEGIDGLINQFHTEFKEWIEKDKLRLSGAFYLSETDFKSLDLLKKKHIKGRNFLIEKVQVTLTKNQIKPALVDLIEI